MKKFKMFLTLMVVCNTTINASTLTAEVKATAHQSMGFKDQSTYIVCGHQATVTNHTGAFQKVYVNYTICAENNGCDTRKFKIMVGEGIWHDSIQRAMYPVYHHEGHYKLTCKTTVVGLAEQEDTNDIGIN